MPREPVEATRRVYEAWARGDFRSATALYDPNVLLVLRPEFPEAGAYVGPEQIAGYMRDLVASLTDFAIEAEDFVEAGDSVVVQVRQHGVGRSSGAVTEHRYFQVLTWRGEKIVRIESIADREQALAAVGLREHPH
ncbi:MAG: nuclear transport factor 2 family protein [Actinomycetota bacterium]|nr:nuclear transport factor 2 family protein [Actinomycetota bacterium]